MKLPILPCAEKLELVLSTAPHSVTKDSKIDLPKNEAKSAMLKTYRMSLVHNVYVCIKGLLHYCASFQGKQIFCTWHEVKQRTPVQSHRFIYWYDCFHTLLDDSKLLAT